MTVSFFPPIVDDPLLSVHLHARVVERAVRARGIDLRVVSFARRNHRLLPERINAAYNRFILYPRFAARHRGEINHIYDHYYSHLLPALGRERTLISCNSMTMPKVLAGELPLPPIPLSWRPTHFVRYRLLAACPTILAATEATREDLQRVLRCRPEQVHVVPEGIDHETFRDLRSADPGRLETVRIRYGLNWTAAESTLMMVVGTRAPFKNRITSLKVFAELRRRGQNVHLVFVGLEFLPDEAAVVAATGLATHITRLEMIPTEDVAALYNLADVVVFPSWDEGFGHPPLEAMACATPTVVSDIAVLRETTAGAALSAAPGDVAALADRAEQILSNRALGADLGRRGRERAAHFTWERYAEGLGAVYAQVGGGACPRA